MKHIFYTIIGGVLVILIALHLAVFALLFYPTHKLITHINGHDFRFADIEETPEYVQQLFRVPEDYQIEIHSDSTSGKVAYKILSFRFNKTFDDTDIKELYLNSLDFGGGVIGINAASNYYYSKPVNKISLEEGIMVASLYEIFSN